MNSEPIINQDIQTEVKLDKEYYDRESRGDTTRCIRGTSILKKFYTNTISECCFCDSDDYPHYLHSDKKTLQGMAEQDDKEGFIISLLGSVGNLTQCSFILLFHNLKNIFSVLKQILTKAEALPTRQEYEENRKDDKQILGLLKLIAQKQGMSSEQIDNLRPPNPFEGELDV